MAQKRHFDDEVVNEGSSKHPRQDGPNNEVISSEDSFIKEDGPEKPCDSGEVNIQKSKSGFGEQHENGSCTVISRKAIEETETELPRSASLSRWATSSPSEDEPPKELVHLPVFPGYFSFDRHVRSITNADDVYYYLLDYPPRKRVPVGPEHQVDIPGWGSQRNTSDGVGESKAVASQSNFVENDDYGEMEGICVLPSPETEPPTYNISEKVAEGRTDCRCPDKGSIRCVRQHIIEAREKLRKTLSEKTFFELGFDDMGEVVAEKWSEDEEQLFHEVVYSNPVSLGKNFWNALSAVFPSRTKMEIVSYYFNVFMLRKRAEQNRCCPMNIDSDDDEWHGSDNDGGDEGRELEEEDDSGVESPTHHDGLELHPNGSHGHETKHDDHDDGDLSDEAREDEDNGAGFFRKSDTDSTFQLTGKKASDDRVENDVHDGSCTSSDSGGPVQGAQLKTDSNEEWHDYILDSSDAKAAWVGYDMSCSKSNVDFLPTCSMIEEVFGGVKADNGEV